MQISGIIFDFGGVIVNDGRKFTYEVLAKKFKVSYKQIERAVEKAMPDYETGRIDNLEFFRRIARALKFSGQMEGFETLWDDVYARKSRIDRNVQKLIKRLKDSGYRLALLSNTEPGRAKYNRENYRYRYFDLICLSSEVGVAKPDKRIYKLVLNQLKLKANKCIFVDDKEKYLLPARKLGIHTIQYKNYKQLERDLKTLGIKFTRKS